jgi:DNA-binding PadR family transcriptional regulator
VAHGLATARKVHVGRRPRTVYGITGKGRRALRRWMARDNAPHALEFEAVAKIFFADQCALGPRRGGEMEVSTSDLW